MRHSYAPLTTLLKGASLFAFTAMLALASAARADHDEERSNRHKGEKHEHHGRGGGKGPKVKITETEEFYRYDYKDKRCKYRYMYNYKSGKSQLHEKGDCRGVARGARPVARGVEPPPRAIPPAPRRERARCDRKVLGAVIGGAIGAVVGAKLGKEGQKILTTAGGAVVGAVIGGVIGRAMDKGDHACVNQALEFAQPDQVVEWDNPEQNATYVVTPLEEYQGASGQECRKFEMQATIAGSVEQTAGQACRQMDGSWLAVE